MKCKDREGMKSRRKGRNSGRRCTLVIRCVLNIRPALHMNKITPLHQFPRSKSVTSRRGQNSVVSKEIIIIGWNVFGCVRCVVSFPKFHYNDFLPTTWQLPRLWRSYGETCLMDFGQYRFTVSL